VPWELTTSPLVTRCATRTGRLVGLLPSGQTDLVIRRFTSLLVRHLGRAIPSVNGMARTRTNGLGQTGSRRSSLEVAEVIAVDEKGVRYKLRVQSVFIGD